MGPFFPENFLGSAQRKKENKEENKEEKRGNEKRGKEKRGEEEKREEKKRNACRWNFHLSSAALPVFICELLQLRED